MTDSARRLATRALLWGAPAALLGAATPVRASRPYPECHATGGATGTSAAGGLTVELTGPDMDWATLEPRLDETIWKNTRFTDQMRQPAPEDLKTPATTRAALPTAATVTNNGDAPVDAPSGTAEFEMRDAGTDHSPLGSDQVGAVTSNPRVIWERASTGRNGREVGQRYSWRLDGSLEPGESLEMPLLHYSPWTFANVDFTLLVRVTAGEAVAERVGHVPGYSTG
ncbi:hypothetical protein [Kytococcus sp. Marseille-QA3725]